MIEETVLIALLCFVLGLLLRGELQRFRKQKKEAQQK
jgi:hypothetical protein